ncbi:hypothetical protein ACWD7C_03285 [Streptomyces sp. NPDC005134]
MGSKVRLGAAAVAMSVLSACASLGGGGAEPELGSVPTPNSLDPGQIVTPLDAYLPSPEENYTLKKARVLLVNRCMRRLGYPDNPQPLGRYTGRPMLSHTEFLVSPIPQVEQYGFKSPAGERERTGSDADAAYVKKATKLQGKLLSGRISTFNGKKVPAQGCEGEALRVITKGARTPQEVTLPGGNKAGAGKGGFGEGYAEMVVSAARSDVMAKVWNDGRFTGAVENWSKCMAKQGYEYDDPRKARNDPRWQKSEQAGKEEISTAIADMRCKKKLNYLGIGIAVESAYEKQAVEKDAEILGRAKDLTSQWIKNANNALQAG